MYPGPAPAERSFASAPASLRNAFWVWLGVTAGLPLAAGIDEAVRGQPGEVTGALLSSFATVPIVIVYSLLFWYIFKGSNRARVAFIVLKCIALFFEVAAGVMALIILGGFLFFDAGALAGAPLVFAILLLAGNVATVVLLVHRDSKAFTAPPAHAPYGAPAYGQPYPGQHPYQAPQPPPGYWPPPGPAGAPAQPRAQPPPGAQAPAAAPPQPSAPTELTCPHCGRSTPVGRGYCAHCRSII